MTIIRAIAFLLNFTLIPIAVGRLITYRARKGWISDYLVGFFGNLAIFYVLYSIIMWIQVWITFTDPIYGGFTLLLKAYFTVVGVMTVAWLLLEWKRWKRLYKKTRVKARTVKKRVKKDFFVGLYIFVFAALLATQLYMAYAYEINEWSYDDYDYVVSAQDTVTYDTLSYINYIDGSRPNVSEKRAVASWITYTAMLAKVSGFEVTTVCHTILPVILLLVAYLSIYYIAKFLFSKFDDRMIFMILVSVAYIFGLYSHYSVTFRLLGAIWQGKAVLTVIAVPFFAVYMIRAYSEKFQKGMLLPMTAISLGACSLTSLSIVFISITAGMVWIMMCIYRRRVCCIGYLIASLLGVIYTSIFYVLVWLLQSDMKSYEDDKYFFFRKRNDWWYKWFQ